jgi:hypothetical protein
MLTRPIARFGDDLRIRGPWRCTCPHEVDGVMEAVTVLILVRDVLGGGLFAALAEGIERRPVFPFNGERAEAAVERLRPSWVLLECYHPAARSDAFFSATEGAQSRVILFAPSAPWEDCEQIARRRAVAAFVHPGDGQSLSDLVQRALLG